MATISDLANIAAATAAGYELVTEAAATANNGLAKARLIKSVTGEKGTTGNYRQEAIGEATTLTTAKTKALTSLNAVRKHRYAGAPGAADGATIATWPDGAATIPTKDVN